MQSNLNKNLHVAIIMDGNGRWAKARGLPRNIGHQQGAVAVERVVAAAPDHGIGTLTLFAFATANWRRPAAEVQALLGLFQRYLNKATQRCVDNGVRLSVLGRRDRFPAALQAAIRRSESLTASGDRLHLRIAADYSARAEIAKAAITPPRPAQPSTADPVTTFADRLDGHPPAGDVDLLIRSGGERRLSDFLLWECANAELLFIDKYWPDFDAADLAEAVAEFHRRDRRFGAVREAV